MNHVFRFLFATIGVILAGVGGYFLQHALNMEAGPPASAVFSQAAASMQGQSRPSFVLPDLEGVPHDVKEWDGKVLVLNFWATWCPPCRTEIPGFIELQEKYGEQGLQFVGIAIDEPEATAEFIKTMGVNYPILIGDSDAIKVAQSYGNQIGALPYTAIIDRGGRIVFVKHGEISKEETEEAILALL